MTNLNMGVASLVVAHLLLIGTANAQDRPAGTASDAADTATNSAQLDDIVVTAQKRAQNLQETPVAVSAISTEKLDLLSVRETTDLSGLTPNVTIMQGTTNSTAAVISIRGIPTPGDENMGLDTANALYVDGVYMARSAATTFEVADIQRVEVLRGPQGTLFGRNTTGGAISFITRDPSDTFRLVAKAGYGNYNAWNGKIVVDPGQIAGFLSTSFAYAHSQRDGVFDNILEPDKSKDPGARKSDAVRVSLMAKLGGTGSFRYTFDWSKVVARTPPFQLTNVSNGAFRAPILGVDATQPAPVQPYLASVTFLQPGCAALATARREYRHDLCLQDDGPSEDRIWGHNVRVENDFGAVRLVSTTGWRHWRNIIANQDLDGIGTFRGPSFTQATLFNGMPAGLLGFIPTIPAAAIPFISASPVPTTTHGLFSITNRRRQEQFSQEIELSGKSDWLDWVAGGFYFWEKGFERNPQSAGFILDTNQIFLANFGALGPSFAAANPARYRLFASETVLDYQASAESEAVYAQATFYPGGRSGPLNITAGLRQTWDSKQFVRYQNGDTPYAVPQRGDAKFSKLTWNAMLGYRIAEDINFYARAATGYRSGGFNARDAAVVGTTRLPSFQPESVISYEAGFKTELFDRHLRFNIAAYRNNYDDLAVTVPVDSGGGSFGTKIINAGKVTYTGIEIEALARFDEHFSIDASFGHVDIKYKEFMVPASGVVGAPLINIASVIRPAYTSPTTANAAFNVEFPLPGGAKLHGRVGYTYESRKYSFASPISAIFNDQISSDPRNLIDAQISIDKIRVGGGELELVVWGKNLTNSHDFIRAVDFGALGYAGGYYGDPRTYGASLKVSF
jgi:iron complex outermembrane receptor protein